jgi:alpha-glucosidase (family GH31 glycosyl hydrolase)
MFTGERFTGKCEKIVSAGINEFPLYARGGTPIPMQAYTARMTSTPLETLIIRCYPGEANESVLYEDDGQSNAYLKKQCSWTRLGYRRVANGVIVRIEAASGRFTGQAQKKAYRIELPCTQKANSAMLNGVSVSFEYDAKTSTNVIAVPLCSINKSIEMVLNITENT